MSALRTTPVAVWQARDVVASISLSYLGEMPFELVSSVRVENIYSDFCGTVGRVYTRGSKPHWPKQAEVQVPT